MVIEMFKKAFKTSNNVQYHNAMLLELIGKEYDNIMEYGLGRNWTYSDIDSKLYERLNYNLNTEIFKKDMSVQKVLLLLERTYNDRVV